MLASCCADLLNILIVLLPFPFIIHFHLKLALSVRRKWERKLGLFMALPVASDLKIFSLKKLFKDNFNDALIRKQLLHDSHLVKILSILGRGGWTPSRLTLTADERTRAATSFWSGEGWPAGQMGAGSSPAKVVSIYHLTQNGIFPSISCLPIAKLFCHCVWDIRSPRMQTFDILPACTVTHHSCWINNKGDNPVLRPCSPSAYHLQLKHRLF